MLISSNPNEKDNEIIRNIKRFSENLMKRFDMDESNSERFSFALVLEKIAKQINEKLIFEEDFQRFGETDLEIGVNVDRFIKDPSLLDLLYETLISAGYRKKYGQFLTPNYIAEFMSIWINQGKPQHVLDPAVGSGIFLDKIFQTAYSPSITLWGFDIDPLLLNACQVRLKLRKIPASSIHLIQQDFVKIGDHLGRKFGGIICNPPYLNFHNFDREELIKIIETQYETKLSRLTNIYALFFMQSLAFGKKDARFAFVTPSEFLYTGYGEELKEFLLKHTTIDSLILIDFQFLIFNTALTTAVLTLFRKSKPDPHHKVKFIRIFKMPSTIELIKAVRNGIKNHKKYQITEILQEKLNPKEKWLKHFIRIKHVDLLNRLIPLSQLTRINRGIATGFNKYFVLSKSQIKELEIEKEFAVRVISKTTQCKGYEFTTDDWNTLKENDEKVFLLYVFKEPSPSLREYIEHGEKIEADKRYLTKHRFPWYSMEKREPAKILATVFHREKMRFILNRANVRNLTAFHCVYPKFENITMIKALLAYLNSDLCKDIQTIKRREYGGGLHKFEPKDLENIPALDVTRLSKDYLENLASMFDRLCSASRGKKEENQIRRELDELLRQIISKIAVS